MWIFRLRNPFLGYMDIRVSLVAVVLLCGCIQEAQPPVEAVTTSTAAQKTTTTAAPIVPFTADDDFVYYLPTTSTETSTSTSQATTHTTATGDPGARPTSTSLSPLIRTFTDKGGEVCKVDGKPVIRMYSRVSCEHCLWSGPIFDKVVREYVDAGRIVAHHWVFDRLDDSLTQDVEGAIPGAEYRVFYGDNQTTVPYFNFGCRFARTGNGNFIRNRPDIEEAEFRAVIEQLLS